jgi:hypothetical protein
MDSEAGLPVGAAPALRWPGGGSPHPLFTGQPANSVNPKKVLVLVLSFDREPYRSIETQGQRPTWVAAAPPNVPVLFYYGVTRGLSYWPVAVMSRVLFLLGQPGLRKAFLRRTGARYALRARETGDQINVRIPDIYGNIGAKTVGALRHVLRSHSFDYLFRTNTSSYVFLPLLHQFVQTLSGTGCYAGLLGQTPKMTFVGGAGILLSRELVEFAVGDAAWDWDLVDDLALARSMARAGVAPRPLPRIDVLSPDEVPLVPPDQWRTCFHVRCRSAGNRLQDIESMRRVHAAYLTAWRT